MTYGATPDIFLEFNLYEALFWLLIGAICLVVISRVSSLYRTWLLFTALNNVLFGVTDVIELYTGGFLHTAQWLLVWKVLHVVGLVVSVVWYLHLRLQAAAGKSK